MWGALIGSALGVANSIAGAVGKNKSIDRSTGMLNKRLRENENWYNRRYNEDVTQRADAQRLLSMMEEDIKRRNRAAAGRQAVMGGTDESVAAEKEANNKAYADVVSQIAAEGEKRKDAIEQQYLNRKDNLENKMAGLESERAGGLDILGGALGAAGSGLAAGAKLDYYLKKK